MDVYYRSFFFNPYLHSEEEEERDGENVAGVDVGGQSVSTSHQVLHDNHVSYINSEVVNVDDLPAENADEVAAEVERHCSSQGIDIDGLFCSICYEAWSSGGGDHHVCCLPCGHMYGLSCIKKWLLRPGSSKCPRCRKKCGVKSIRLLYASRVVAVDAAFQKTVESLEAECASLRSKNAEWSKKEAELKKEEAGLGKKLQYLREMFYDIEVRKILMYDMVRQIYEFQIGREHSELSMYEMIRQMHELLIGEGHSEPLRPRQGE